MKVMKFGGTSVQTKDARHLSALKVISAKEQGYWPVVVVSAIGRKGEPYATDTLISLLRDLDPAVEPEPRELDLLMACGEILSSVIFAHTLKSLGQSAISLRGGQAGIRTDGQYGNARILGINPTGIYEAINRGLIPVVCGFQGVWIHGGLPGAELTTLGRGGSDTTASGLGAALKAERIEIFTDVDGIKTADPRMVATAPTLRKVTYDEVAEVAHLGAKVVHPRAAEIAMRFDIPLWVKNTFTDDEGTEIVPKDRFPGRRVTGVTHAGKLVFVQASLTGVPHDSRVQFVASVYQTLARHSINLYMINLSPGSIGFAVQREQYSSLIDLFDGLVVPIGSDQIFVIQAGMEASQGMRSQLDLLKPLGDSKVIPLQVTEGCTMVSVVGHDYMQQPGVFWEALSKFAAEGIPVLQTSDSDYSLSFLIPESELAKAVRVLHQSFELNEAI